eukprot:gene6726-847_t
MPQALRLQRLALLREKEGSTDPEYARILSPHRWGDSDIRAAEIFGKETRAATGRWKTAAATVWIEGYLVVT